MGSVITILKDGVYLSDSEVTKMKKLEGGEKFRVFVPDYYKKYKVIEVEVIYCGEWALFDGSKFYGNELNGSWTDVKIE